jgi:hypothetical protein
MIRVTDSHRAWQGRGRYGPFLVSLRDRRSREGMYLAVVLLTMLVLPVGSVLAEDL